MGHPPAMRCWHAGLSSGLRGDSARGGGGGWGPSEWLRRKNGGIFPRMP